MKLYLLGREFIVQTDHCPLRDMHKEPSNNRRVDHISLILQQYNIKEIRHVFDKCNCMADYLTRYLRQLEDEDFIQSDFGSVPGIQHEIKGKILNNQAQASPPSVGAVITRAQARAQVNLTPSDTNNIVPNNTSIIDDQPQQKVGHEFDVSTIVDTQKGDKLYQEKILEINKNRMNGSYVLENDILYKIINRSMFTKKLIYVPTPMIEQILFAYHDSPWAGYFGFRRTYLKSKDKYWWPNMKITIQNYIRSCIQCQKFNIDRRKPPGLLNPIEPLKGTIEPPKDPFQLIGIDYSGPFPTTPQGNKYVLSITNYFTRWVIAIPLPNQTAKTTAEALYEHYICIYGVPSKILSDQGPHFNNRLIAAFTHILGCHHIKSTPYHPQTNGVIERFNSTFERQLTKLTDQHLNDWDMHLKSIVFAFNTGQHATTRYSPYQLQFGRNPTLSPGKPPAHYEFSKPNDYFKQFQQTMQIYHQQARINMKQVQQKYKQKFGHLRADIHYNVGGQILKRLSINPSKLSAIYSNPMTICKKQHPTYWVQDQDDQQVYQVHVSQLRNFNLNHSLK